MNQTELLDEIGLTLPRTQAPALASGIAMHAAVARSSLDGSPRARA